MCTPTPLLLLLIRQIRYLDYKAIHIYSLLELESYLVFVLRFY